MMNEKIFKKNKELMEQVKECKVFKKLDVVPFSFAEHALVDMIVEQYKVEREDAKFIAENLIEKF